MNIGMIIGSDGKLNTILGTLKALSTKCKRFVICDTGNWILNPDIEDIVKSFKNTEYMTLSPLTKFNLYDARTATMNSFLKDEWFLFVDADERPSLSLVEDWETVVNKLDKIGIKIGTISGSPHFYGKRLPPTPEWFETEDKKASDHSNLFVKKIIVKNSDDVKSVHVGNHSDWTSLDGRTRYIGNGFCDGRTYYYIHTKTSFQKANGHMMCAHNIYDINWHLPSENISDHLTLLRLNGKYGLNTSNDVVNFILTNDDYPQEILDYMSYLGHNSKNPSLAVFCGIWSFYILAISRKFSDSEFFNKSEALRDCLKNNVAPNAGLPLTRVEYDISKTFKENYVKLLNDAFICNHFCCKYNEIQL